MTAGGQEQAIRKGGRVGQPRGERVGFQMIDGDQRLVVHKRNRFRHRQPDDHPADQAGSGGRRNSVERTEPRLRLVH